MHEDDETTGDDEDGDDSHDEMQMENEQIRKSMKY